MRKMTIVVLSLVLISIAALCLSETVSFPDQLETIESEAFMNTAAAGLVQLPDTVVNVGKYAFRNTALYALEVPDGVVQLEDQGLEGQAVAYALLKSSAVPSGGLKGIRYLFYAGDTAPVDAPEGAVLIPYGDLISDGMFYYCVQDGFAKLLCAVNNLLVPADVVIGDDVDGIPVAQIAEDALIGCPHIASISLPENVEAMENAFSSCPNAKVTYRKTLRVWVAENAVGFTDSLLAAFWDANPQYSAWNYSIRGVSEGDAVYELQTNPYMLPDVYSFAQDQLAVLANAGFLNVPSEANAADIRSGNDAGAVSAAALNGKLYAYPFTSDNGYFLYYDKSVITNAATLESILSACEAANRSFCAEITSGWYNVMFFFGTGCKLEYTVGNDGAFTGFNGSLANENGLRALKAMIRLAQSSAFVNSSSALFDLNMAAVVSGIWDADNVLSRFGQNAAAVKLPTCDGFQLGSFSGCKLFGVIDQDSSERLALAHAVAAFLSGEEAQTSRQRNLGWIASRPAARAKAPSFWYENAFVNQSAYAVPQGQYPSDYWTQAELLGNRIINGELDSMSDQALMNVLQQYQANLAAAIE